MKRQRQLKPDEPNIVVALASSYNERGVAGFTHTVTNGEDQRKLNVMYEPVKNPMTGKGTLTLTKRPGVVIDDVTSSSPSGGATWGDSTQEVFLIHDPGPGVNAGKQYNNIVGFHPYIFTRSGFDIRAHTDVTNTVIVTIGGGVTGRPIYSSVVTTYVAGVPTDYILVQIASVGSPFQRVFYAPFAAWSEITDVDFTPGIVHLGMMQQMDGYLFILGQDRNVWNSDLNSIANWTSTSFIAKQIISDVGVGLARLKNQILAFGENTVEVFVNGGGTTGSPLSPLKHLFSETGMIAPLHDSNTTRCTGNYYCTIGSTLYFLGRKAHGGTYAVSLFAYNGSTFEEIASNYFDKFVSSAGFLDAYVGIYTMEVNGEVALALPYTDPNSGSTQKWLMYFPRLKEWFEWSSDVFCPITSGEYFLGTSSGNKNKIYRFIQSDNWQDQGVSYPWFTQFKHPGRNARNFMQMYGVEADTDTVANNLTVEVSDNDCASFSTLGTIDMTQERKVNFRGGSFYRRHVRIGNTNARPCRIHHWLARLD